MDFMLKMCVSRVINDIMAYWQLFNVDSIWFIAQLKENHFSCMDILQVTAGDEIFFKNITSESILKPLKS